MEALGETRIDRAVRGGSPGALRPDLVSWPVLLRSAFPRWGIVHDPFAGLWIAVRGRTRIEVAPTPAALYERLRSDGCGVVARHHPGPWPVTT